MKMKTEDFKKKFPHLAKEILSDDQQLTLRVDIKMPDPWRGYTPGIEDYIRRCRTVDEALKVVDYLEKRGEINHAEADNYRKLLCEKGLSYFGPRKEDDYYYKKARDFWKKMRRKSIGEQRQQRS
ncbi:MAG: DUF2095 domain-containing protein [Crenarchaeota archaeon]|nr:DUF2095 domain-containing protein [Thermoproteota archaeon]